MHCLGPIIQSIKAGADVQMLARQIGALKIPHDEIRPYIRFSESGYTRNLIVKEPGFEILVLCWQDGQRSPIHDHGGSCGIDLVYQGVMAEDTFKLTPSGYLRPSESRDLRPGEASVAGADDIHQMSNLQGGGKSLITIHFYIPPLGDMRVFNLHNRSFGRWHPNYTPQFHEGLGI